MESWNFGSEGKGFVLSDEMLSNTDDGLARSRTVLMGWDLKTPCNYDNTRGFMELGLPDINPKPLPEILYEGFWGTNLCTGRVQSSTCLNSSKATSGKDSSSRISNSNVDSNSQESSLIDWKLGRLSDYQDSENGKFPKELPVFSSFASSMPERKTRTLNSYQTPFCQVLGCNMDLSHSKDYHKKHKVCYAHSKTAEVIVNGIQQRFCQQCSRFHLLVEFDDGKRSCRKRLAGHNERRRKPQLDNHCGRSGGRYMETSLPTRTSFICPDILPNGGILQPFKYETNSWCKRVKLEDEAIYSPTEALTVTNQHIPPKSYLPPYGLSKQYPSLISNGINCTQGSNINENNKRYAQNWAGSNSFSQFVLRGIPSGSEGCAFLGTASTIQGLSGPSDSNSALSLLSFQSQNSSSHSSGIAVARLLTLEDGHVQCSLGHNF